MIPQRPPALGAIFATTRKPIEFDNYAGDYRTYPEGTVVQIKLNYDEYALWWAWPVDDEHEDDPLSALILDMHIE